MTEPAPAEPIPQPRWRAWARWAMLVLGFAGLAVVARQAAMDQDGGVVPAGPVAAAAVVLAAGTGLSAARGWTDLLGPDADAREARGAMYLSQLTKYIPAGGLVQAAGQVALSATATLPVSVVALAWATSVVLTVVAGTTLMTLLVFSSELPLWARCLAPLGLVSLLAVDRRRLAWVLAHLRRFVHRIPSPERLPSEPALHQALAWILISFSLTAAAFTLLLHDLDPSLSPIDIAPAYVAAWLVGFLLVPLPAGLGAREVVLVALIPGASPGLLVSASLAQRLLAVVAEVVLVVGHRLLAHRAHRSDPTDR